VAPASGGWPVVATLAWVGMLVQIPLLSRLAMLESGKVKSLRDLAAREGIDNSYVSRMINLTTLAPDIVAAILDDALPNHLTLFDLAVDPPALWEKQWGRVRSVLADAPETPTEVDQTGLR
jgi:hypothetical protein